MSSDISFTIASRKSPLAVRQAEMVRDMLMASFAPSAQDSNDRFLIETFVTEGDRRLSGSLAEIGGKGLFTKEVERALLDESADIAVHSMKDMPAILPEGLVIAAIPQREDPRDAFISPIAIDLDGLPLNARFGTSSVRRAAQLLNKRPDLSIVPLRGNVGSRLEKLRSGQVDATLLAEAGLRRLDKKEVIRTILEPEEMLPAVSQGILCIQMRAGDPRRHLVAQALGCENTGLASAAERAFLTHLDGSCQTPIAGLAVVKPMSLDFTAQLLSLDGQEQLTIEDTLEFSIEDYPARLKEAAVFGTTVAKRLYSAAPDSVQQLIRPV